MVPVDVAAEMRESRGQCFMNAIVMVNVGTVQWMMKIVRMMKITNGMCHCDLHFSEYLLYVVCVSHKYWFSRIVLSYISLVNFEGLIDKVEVLWFKHAQNLSV